MIYYDKLDILLSAIQAKNVDSILLNKTNIPWLGKNYNKNQLQNWLKKRIDVLIDIRDGSYSDIQIQTFVNNIINSLSPTDQIIANNIIYGGPPFGFPETEDAYEKIVLIYLYKFVTTP